MGRPRKPVPTISRAFMVLEATSSHGGFGVYMNTLMENMKTAMELEGHTGPYKWSFGGGDGYAVPITLVCSQ